MLVCPSHISLHNVCCLVSNYFNKFAVETTISTEILIRSYGHIHRQELVIPNYFIIGRPISDLKLYLECNK